jgi:hypothetical protein
MDSSARSKAFTADPIPRVCRREGRPVGRPYPRYVEMMLQNNLKPESTSGWEPAIKVVLRATRPVSRQRGSPPAPALRRCRNWRIAAIAYEPRWATRSTHSVGSGSGPQQWRAIGRWQGAAVAPGFVESVGSALGPSETFYGWRCLRPLRSRPQSSRLGSS